MKNYIFDVDRTLVDSYSVELKSLKEALKIVTGKEFSSETMCKLTTLTTDEFFREIGIYDDKTTLAQVNKNWAMLLADKKIQFFDGIKEQLQILKGKNCFLAIATSRDKEELEELECLMDIIDIFDFVVTSDMISNPKPDPESIIYILNKFNLKLEDTVYVGDSVGDYMAASRAGIKFAYAGWENKNQPIDRDFVLNNPSDIITLYET